MISDGLITIEVKKKIPWKQGIFLIVDYDNEVRGLRNGHSERGSLTNRLKK